MWEFVGILRPLASASGLSIRNNIFLKTTKYSHFKEQVCGCFRFFGKNENNSTLAPLCLSHTCEFPDTPELK